MSKYSKKAEATGAQSVLEAERETKKYSKILDTVMNDEEFKEIWKAAPAAIRLNFIMNALKYVFKEKGRETESNANMVNGKLDDLDVKMQALTKLLNS